MKVVIIKTSGYIGDEDISSEIVEKITTDPNCVEQTIGYIKKDNCFIHCICFVDGEENKTAMGLIDLHLRGDVMVLKSVNQTIHDLDFDQLTSYLIDAIQIKETPDRSLTEPESDSYSWYDNYYDYMERGYDSC